MSSLEVWGLVIATVSLIVSVAGLVPLYLDFRSRRKIDFELLRFRELWKQFNQPNPETTWGIRILHPSKPIERCSVSYNGEKLRWDKPDEPYYENFIAKMSGGNVRIPKEIEKDDATVEVRDEARTLTKRIRKKKFQEIPIVPA